ncbi:Brp/Blh family beta-carotene 15,15'-dioxygenase [Candidatus Pelagibacter sp.]|nr:Brp/Blh family beta-carotene 15,15'-dioxygenase [Candidatus Pelagibacter sp.]
MIKKINYNHSLIFFISCIFLSSFDYLRSNSFILICFFLILILGVSHGALDNIKGRKLIKILKIKNIFYFYLVYILIGLGIILLWILFPQSLLLLFLIIASYHFGKEDSEFISKNQKQSFLLKTFKGSIIIVSPLLFNQNKTLEIFNSINFGLSNTLLVKTEFLVILLLLSFISNLILSFNKNYDEKSVLLMDFFSIITLNIFLNPLLAFTIYFCFLHSFRHSIKLIFELNKNLKKGIFLFVKKALPLTFITGIIFIVALNFLNYEFKLNESVNMVIFIGLASLTFPHILLEYLIEKNEK